jgi:hypothetical protein
MPLHTDGVAAIRSKCPGRDRRLCWSAPETNRQRAMEAIDNCWPNRACNPEQSGCDRVGVRWCRELDRPTARPARRSPGIHWAAFIDPAWEATPVQHFIETQNISHFKALLQSEVDPDKRRVLVQLLANEQAKSAARQQAERGQLG